MAVSVSGRGKALFVLFMAVIAATFAMAGCGGKTPVNPGQAAEKPAANFWSGEIDTDWYSEDKSEFVINTAEELAGLAELVNEGGVSFKGKTVRLGRDITINDTANWRDWANNPPARRWTGIGTDEERFHGTFDGGGHTVSGVYTKKWEGLFGVIGHYGKVKKLSVTASYIKGGDQVGILARCNAGVITECYVSGIVVGDRIVGGLAGINDGLISGSYADGSVKGEFNVGGFIGVNRIGAAVGNHSSTAVSGDYSDVGGFVGANWGALIYGNFSTGKVAGSGKSIGGFAGGDYGGMMRNNYYDRETSGQSDSGKGEGKTTAEMRSKKFADSLNFIASLSSANAWIHSDSEYPALSGKIADAAGIDGCFASGKGTDNDPYMINTREQLENFSVLVNTGVNFSGKHLMLGQSIALNDTADWQKWNNNPPDYVWTPIGMPLSPFGGTFDGGGHTVSGIYVSRPKSLFIGLFGSVSEGAVIKNTGVTASFISGDVAVGGLVGGNGNAYDSGGRIIGCYSTAAVVGKGEERQGVGGLAGFNVRGAVIGCYATGEVRGKSTVGGLVGANKGGAVIGCYAAGEVYGGSAIGGLVGGSVDGGKISNSYSTGKVTGHVNTGGLVGFNEESAINACYTAGKMAEAGEYTIIKMVKGREYMDLPEPEVNPLVGKDENPPGKVSNCYFDSQTSGAEAKDNYIGTGRTTEQMKRKETFAGWDFDRVWGMDSAVNGGYPHLLGKLDESAISELEAIRESDESDDFED